MTPPKNKSADVASQFVSFRKAFVIKEDDIVSWLGDKPRLLLIDELNTGTENALRKPLKISTHFLNVIT
jgi:hypothetical protein